MVLTKIQSAIADYKNWLLQLRHHPSVYKWESLQQFQAHWDPDASDPVAMFDQCFQNSVTKRLWQQENWYPKKMMLAFWELEPQMVRAMFDDLFNETRDAEARIGRFLFGCDELLRDYKRAHPTSVENNHYHDDYRMIALYLGFRYPDQYAPYEFVVFREVLEQFQARDIPEQNDIGRYFKVLRTLMNFLEKDGEVVPAINRHLKPQQHFPAKTLLLAEDFCQFVAARSGG
ncbi:MAG: hypothetical protein EP344_06635 [Bacteroidetes bacterium]|nr:MAG: hypothetical protein EP344_06635 [Bacteroidota bacterium]